MANMIFHAKTNYFRVKDEAAYQKIFNNLSSEDLEDITQTQNGVLYHGFISSDAVTYFDTDEKIKELFKTHDKVFDEDGNPLSIDAALTKEELFDENGNYIFSKWDHGDFDTMISSIQKILPDGECFIYTEICHEKFRFIDGYAVVASNKDRRDISLSRSIDKFITELVGQNSNVTKPC